MKSMKKILTILLAVALAGAMTTTAFAAPEAALVTVSKEGNGQIAISDDSSEPVFDDFPSQNVTL